ncbi:MAG TPA: LAGLIDADG family homing endonuclease [Gammaproteobacteria bacterium]
MSMAFDVKATRLADIPLQEASLDIWDTKYRLKTKAGEPVDRDIEATYERVARALADVEAPEKRDECYRKFLWALRRGAIPAGRIISNAGAEAHKPATSTINCTVSGTIHDSMHDILDKVHEAGLTLKAGSGIGYEFSTLRPRGAYVSGAGAYTSGPLSFMDIYDKMCFTVSSAGGRRGAQMGTFDVGHPDVLDFIRAKREDGRLRQFNLSLLITDEFMQAVKEDKPWRLAFPLTRQEVEDDGVDLDDPERVVWREWPITEGYVCNEQGFVACKVYRTLPARRLWDLIMSSTYDFAEPGFVLIDRVNEMNNNWWCENIRATNPCVTADTWVHTSAGPRQVRELIGTPFVARVQGRDWTSGAEGFFYTATKPVVRIATAEGYALRLTADHRVRCVTGPAPWSAETEWRAAGELRPGDRVLLNDHRAAPHWKGAHGFDEGYVVGLLIGNGAIDGAEAVLAVREPESAVNSGVGQSGAESVMNAALAAASKLEPCGGWYRAGAPGEYRLRLGALQGLAADLGLRHGTKTITPEMERASSGFCRGMLRGLFDAEGAVHGTHARGVSVRLAGPDLESLRAAQRMLLRLGIASRIESAAAGSCAEHELVIGGENLVAFRELVGFADEGKAARLGWAVGAYRRTLIRERFEATVTEVRADGVEPVYDVQVPGRNAFDANGLEAHNCGEQPLPPYGACLLGSVNLTKFVVAPFTERAYFDWEEFREVVKVFTRMLDNVVEINGLPLDPQRSEIQRKRRHGMGFLGLGSTIALLGMRYGSAESVEFTERVSRELAIAGWQTGLALSREKGMAPILAETFVVDEEMLRKRPEMAADGWKAGDEIPGRVLHARYSRYMQRLREIEPELVEALEEHGARFTHHSSIAPTGTISLSLANNASNGIEPSFAHHYFRNVIRAGRKTKEKIDVFSFELLAYRELVNPQAMPGSDDPAKKLPDYFVSSEDITPKEHVDIQAAAQKWIDSSISKTANVPTDYPYEDFKDIYLYAHEKGLKGCTTFRFNPEAFQGVLVKEKDLKSTTYRFTLEDGTVVEAKGDDEIEYDGEVHTAANLFDALKEGYYGKF